MLLFDVIGTSSNVLLCPDASSPQVCDLKVIGVTSALVLPFCCPIRSEMGRFSRAAAGEELPAMSGARLRSNVIFRFAAWKQNA